MCLNFIWYYPPSPNFELCEEQTKSDDWYAFFDKLAANGDFNWVVNNDATFVQDTFNSLQASEKLRENPAYTEDLFQSFYNSSRKTATAIVSVVSCIQGNLHFKSRIQVTNSGRKLCKTL